MCFSHISLFPLEQAVLLALEPPVHNLGQGLSVCDHTLLPVVLELFSGQLVCPTPPPRIVLHHQGLCRLLAANIDLPPNVLQRFSGVLILQDLVEGLPLLFRRLEKVVQEGLRDRILHDGGKDPLGLDGAVLQQLRDLLALLVGELHPLVLLHPSLPSTVPVLLGTQHGLAKGLSRSVIPELRVVLVSQQIGIVSGICPIELHLLPVPLLVLELRIVLRVPPFLVLFL
mmetsp:Transcript_131913/g.282095  ORF Transcript_131913/g.282095 Transcript_131913/m.282095 type:complete len:228 (-) Transcript_131913:657-1340(-)